MRFGPLPVGELEGAVLAHTHRLPERRIFKKGRVLSGDDAAAFAQAGFRTVVAARLEPGDVREDVAAAEVAERVAGAGVRVADASTGRANLHARRAGLLRVDPDVVDALNLVDEAITLGTLAPYAVVDEGEMIGTVKIIPFAVHRDILDQALARVPAPPVSVAAFTPRRTGLVLTRLPGLSETLLDRAADSQRTRLARLGGEIVREVRCHHDEDAVAEALRGLLAEGLDLVLAMGASAIVDRADVIPRAVERVGGRVEHLGMPVDPGNLLLLGRAPVAGGDDVPVVGVPGCARSLKESGFDWVLTRLVADLPVDGPTIQRMGAGGLLKEIAARPQPRLAPQRTPPVVDGVVTPRRVGAVVLAAGRSRRMGERNKLLAEVDGKPLVAHAVDALLATSVRPVVVVTGHEAAAVRAGLAGRDVRFVHNPDHAEGMSTSLRAGIAALADEALDAALVSLGDMPWVRPRHVEALVEAFDPASDRTICVPVHARKRGNPVLWAARHFPEMARVSGDVGARALLQAHAGEVALVPVDDVGVHVDVDTPDALEALVRDRTRT